MRIWDRVGVEFGQWIPNTFPGILAGFLMCGEDHKLEIMDKEFGIDLLFTIDVGDREARGLPQDLLDERTGALRRLEPGLRIFDGRENNRKQLLTIQEPLSAILNELTDDIPTAMRLYGRFYQWCGTLFGDGAIEMAIDDIWSV